MLDMVQRRVTLRRASVPAGSPPEQAGTLARRTGRVTRQRAWLYQAGKGKGASVLPTGPLEQGLALRHKPQVPYQSRNFGVTGPQGHRANDSFAALRQPFCNQRKNRRNQGKQREPKSTALCFLCLLRFTTCKAGQRQECL